MERQRRRELEGREKKKKIGEENTRCLSILPLFSPIGRKRGSEERDRERERKKTQRKQYKNADKFNKRNENTQSAQSHRIFSPSLYTDR